MKKWIFAIAALAITIAAPVLAQKAETQAIVPSTEAQKQLDDMREKLEAKLRTMSEDMSPQEKQHFQSTYQNYILMNTVRTVQGHVGMAVTACGKENPEMKSKMDNRYKQWSGAVNPVLEEAKANLDNLVIAQDYAKKEDMDEVFGFIDKTREVAQSQTEYVPVTTPQACLQLHEKMDETQEAMIKLLRQTLMSLPKLYTAPAKPVEKSE